MSEQLTLRIMIIKTDTPNQTNNTYPIILFFIARRTLVTLSSSEILLGPHPPPTFVNPNHSSVSHPSNYHLPPHPPPNLTQPLGNSSHLMIPLLAPLLDKPLRDNNRDMTQSHLVEGNKVVHIPWNHNCKNNHP